MRSFFVLRRRRANRNVRANVKTRKPSPNCNLLPLCAALALLAGAAGGQQAVGQGGAAADVLGCSLEVVVDPSLYSHLRDSRFRYKFTNSPTGT